jgi:hypothetical protein
MIVMMLYTVCMARDLGTARGFGQAALDRTRGLAHKRRMTRAIIATCIIRR